FETISGCRVRATLHSRNVPERRIPPFDNAGLRAQHAATLVPALARRYTRGVTMRIRDFLYWMMAAACATAAQAQTKWDMPTPYSDNEFHTLNVKRFVADVKSAAGGQLDITVHTNGSLIKHP